MSNTTERTDRERLDRLRETADTYARACVNAVLEDDDISAIVARNLAVKSAAARAEADVLTRLAERGIAS